MRKLETIFIISCSNRALSWEKTVQKESSYTMGFLTFSLSLASWDGLFKTLLAE